MRYYQFKLTEEEVKRLKTNSVDKETIGLIEMPQKV